MDKRAGIAEQIRKYLNGELDARAMHLLEKEAQNDPFLAEALDGFEKAGGDQRNNLADIRARLQERVKEKNNRVLLWRSISIAASVLVVLAIGGLWLKNDQPEKPDTKIARVEKLKAPGPVISALPENSVAQKIQVPEIKKKDSLQKPGANLTATNVGAGRADKNSTSSGFFSGINPTPLKKDLANNATTVTGVVTAKEDGEPVPGATVLVKGTSIATQTDINGKFSLQNIPDGSVIKPGSAGYRLQEVSLIKKDSLKINLQPNAAALSEVMVNGYQVQQKKLTAGNITILPQPPLTRMSSENARIAIASPAGKVAAMPVPVASSNIVKGNVMGRDDGQPIPGATVKVKGTNMVTQTDAEGKFNLSGVPDKSVLVFEFIGYEPKEVQLNKRDSLIIGMQPNNNSLSEVVVIGYGTKSISEQPQFKGARPLEGWDAYNGYLKLNAVSPDGKTGTVKLSFVVNDDNSLNDFKILNSVSAKTDSVAISLVKNGPQWLCDSNNKAQKVYLKIKFRAR